MASGRARVAVSILDADHSNMAYAIRRAEREGADRFHIDVMDGHFVPNLTFGAKMIQGIRPRTRLPLDAHLMISDPLQYVDEFLDAGCDSVTFHVEVDPGQIEPTLRRIRAAGRAPGLSVKPGTPLSALDPYRGLFDIVLVMTVEPGFGGQSFMRDVAAEKILAARDYLAHVPAGGEVQVDGGVNRESAEFVGGLAVDILIVGSVLWRKGRNMGREIRLVRALADEGYQYRLNNGKPPIPRDSMVVFAQPPRHLALRFMTEIELGGIPVLPLRGNGAFNPDGVRDYDVLVPASVEALTIERHTADRERYAAEAEAWRTDYIAKHGIKPPETLPPRASVRALLQRTSGARVRVGGAVVGEIETGLVVLLGVGPEDDEAAADGLARRMTELRIFDDEAGRTNLSLMDVGGAVLLVSQFTLYADTRRGRRPGFTGAAAPELAERLYRRVGEALKTLGITVATGRFGAVMAVELVNDGPFTIWLDTADR